MRIQSWVLRAPGAEMTLESREARVEKDQVLVRVAGCGVCHTDLGFVYDGVPTRHPLPLTLGHEVSGVVEEAGPGAEEWLGKKVIVPAVIPCDQCLACQNGRGSICPNQIFPGNDVHGGFGSHLVVPAVGLCPVPDDLLAKVEQQGLGLASLSVVADAVTTPLQAVVRTGLRRSELAVVVGIGGVGGFCVQLAAARGAPVIAIDVDHKKLERISDYGANLCLDAKELPFKELKAAVKRFADEHEVPSWHWRIFECSGSPSGQETAFGLLSHGSSLSVIGYTPQKVNLRLSNLMALDASAQGNWGCLPEHYPLALDLVAQGRVQLAPFVEERPLSTINATFAAVHAHEVDRRVVLVPEN